MRTTVELPADLLRAAKARSAESGESLKSLLTRAVAAELQVASVRGGRKARVELPLFGTAGGPSVRVSNQDLERILVDVDAARTRVPASSRRRSRQSR